MNSYIKDFSAHFYGPEKGSIVTVSLAVTIATLESIVKVQVAYPGVSLDLGQKPTINAQRTIIALDFKCATKTEYPCLLACLGNSVVFIGNINQKIASQLSKRGIKIYDDNVSVQRIVDDRVYLTVQKFHPHKLPEEAMQLTISARVAGADLIVISVHPLS